MKTYRVAVTGGDDDEFHFHVDAYDMAFAMYIATSEVLKDRPEFEIISTSCVCYSEYATLDNLERLRRVH